MDVSVRRRQFTWIVSAFLIVLMLDQVTKAIVIASLDENMAPRFGTFFHFTHQRNEGLVGGLFSQSRIVALAAPMGATLVLLFLFRFVEPQARLQSMAYGMVFGGAMGNLIDRVRLGSVTDFLQFHFYFIPGNVPWKYYPAFNVADSAICVGVVLLVLSWNTGISGKRDASPTP